MTLPTILFAGGGTGGHIFPNVAICQRLKEMHVAFEAHFLVSDRPLDAEIMQREMLRFTPLPMHSLSMNPLRWSAFARTWFASKKRVRQRIAGRQVAALVATGGFVAGPAVVAAKRARVEVALVNLDAVPGKANRWMARHADGLFGVYGSRQMAGAVQVGLPLRRSAVWKADAGEARRVLGLDPEKETLLIVGGSQGARSLNRMMVELLKREPIAMTISSNRWQVLHIRGSGADENLQTGYDVCGICAKVVPFIESMGIAWGAASFAISRAGAGSVAEAWTNATPTIFLPYPMHADEHQRLNAQPMVDEGGAILLSDQIDPVANADQISDPLITWIEDTPQRNERTEQLRSTTPPDGAAVIAGWLADRV